MTWRRSARKVPLLALLALVALWALTWGVAQMRLAAAGRAHPPEGQFVEVEGQRLHAVAMGEGPDVVLIHGSSGSTRDMTFRLAPALAEAGFRVIAIDRPGLGWSPPVRDGELIARQAALLQGAAAALGAERPIVLGQSYGGAVALAWAVEHPGTLAALVSVAGAAYPWEGDASLYHRATGSALGRWTLDIAIAAFAPARLLRSEVAGVFTPQDMPQGYLDHFGPRLAIRPSALYHNARQRLALKPQLADLQAHYPALDLPVEIVHGTADRIVGLSIHSRPLAEAVPNAHLEPLPGIGHMPHHVATEAVVAAVTRAARRAGLQPGLQPALRDGG